MKISINKHSQQSTQVEMKYPGVYINETSGTIVLTIKPSETNRLQHSSNKAFQGLILQTGKSVTLTPGKIETFYCDNYRPLNYPLTLTLEND